MPVDSKEILQGHILSPSVNNYGLRFLRNNYNYIYIKNINIYGT